LQAVLITCQNIGTAIGSIIWSDYLFQPGAKGVQGGLPFLAAGALQVIALGIYSAISSGKDQSTVVEGGQGEVHDEECDKEVPGNEEPQHGGGARGRGVGGLQRPLLES
jgi:hypothetical protein